MAQQTPKTYRNQTIYSIFIRNYSPEGTFEGVRRDLPRVQALGVDMIWLMPIHPTGLAARKGSLGSPYAIRDYRTVNPEFGTMEDFAALVGDIHALGMKCIIDVVYNHTSPDSVLAREHPEWFYRRPDGSFGNRVGDWWDVIDLDYAQPGLWDYQIDTLKFWAQYVDGFRCDVAPLVPLDFWKRARGDVEAVRPGCIWLAESVEPGFITALRGQGPGCLSDAELYQAFDLCYDYDTYHTFRRGLTGRSSLADYAGAVNLQETIYPDNYVKLRFLENHDQPRAAFLLPAGNALENWTAFCFFQKGTAMVYAGQEASCTHCPSLFDRDTVDWSGPDRSDLIRRLCGMKKHPLFTDSVYHVDALPGDFLRAGHRSGARQLVGVFSARGTAGLVPVEAPDGVYENLLGGTAEVRDGLVSYSGKPVVFEAALAL